MYFYFTKKYYFQHKTMAFTSYNMQFFHIRLKLSLHFATVLLYKNWSTT